MDAGIVPPTGMEGGSGGWNSEPVGPIAEARSICQVRPDHQDVVSAASGDCQARLAISWLRTSEKSTS